MNIENTGARARFSDVLSDRSMVQQAEQMSKLPPNVLMQAENAAQELKRLISGASGSWTSGKEKRANAGGPDLTPPRRTLSDVTGMSEMESSNRKLLTLLAELTSALEDAGLKKLATNAQIAALREAIRNAGNEKLAADYDAAQSAVGKAVDELQSLKDSLAGQIKNISELEQQLADAEAALAALTPEAPEYDAAMHSRDALRASLTSAQSELAGAREAVQAQQDKVIGLQKIVDDLLERAKALGVSVAPSAVGKDKSNIERMLTLMSELGELMLNAGEARTQTQREMLQAQQDARIKKVLADADKAEKELAKAEAMNKAMGCVGKILGALLTTIAIVGAVFSGGASLVLAGIGLALMVADEIYKGVTGKSFMEEALKPVMNLIKPLLEFVMNKLGALFEKMGLDPQVAQMVGMILVSVVIALAATALALTGTGGMVANFASKMLSKIGPALTRLLENTIGKLVSELVKRTVSQGARQISAAFRKMADAITKRLGISPKDFGHELVAKRFEQFGGGLNFAKTTTTSGMGVAEQKYEADFVRTNASIKFTSSELDLLKSMLTNLLDRLKDSFSVSQNYFNHASEAINQNASTGVAIARAIRGTASA